MPLPFTPPEVLDPSKVGEYPAQVGSGGGYVWDAVLEYRVWCHPERGAPAALDGEDYFRAFATYAEAEEFSLRTPGSEAPLALVLQREHVDEPTPGEYVHVKQERLTEWPVELLSRPRRTDRTLPDFFAADAPPNRLAILRGTARRAP